MTVQHYDWSAYHSNVRPNKIAIRDLSNNQTLTYKELDDRANKLEPLIYITIISLLLFYRIFMRVIIPLFLR